MQCDIILSVASHICRCDGIGRRSGLKIHRWRQRTGSSPVTGTMWGIIKGSEKFFWWYPAFFISKSIWRSLTGRSLMLRPFSFPGRWLYQWQDTAWFKTEPSVFGGRTGWKEVDPAGSRIPNACCSLLHKPWPAARTGCCALLENRLFFV